MDDSFEKCVENYSYNSIHPLPYLGPTYDLSNYDYENENDDNDIDDNHIDIDTNYDGNNDNKSDGNCNGDDDNNDDNADKSSELNQKIMNSKKMCIKEKIDFDMNINSDGNRNISNPDASDPFTLNLDTVNPDMLNPDIRNPNILDPDITVGNESYDDYYGYEEVDEELRPNGRLWVYLGMKCIFMNMYCMYMI